MFEIQDLGAPDSHKLSLETLSALKAGLDLTDLAAQYGMAQVALFLGCQRA